MHIISKSALKKFWTIYPYSQVGLKYWYKLSSQHKWQNFDEVRQVFLSADQVSKFIVFDICGNNYRLITFIDFQYGKVFIRKVLTHAEYDKNKWKKDEWYDDK